jgi:hypothetical protein
MTAASFDRNREGVASSSTVYRRVGGPRSAPLAPQTELRILQDGTELLYTTMDSTHYLHRSRYE